MDLSLNTRINPASLVSSESSIPSLLRTPAEIREAAASLAAKRRSVASQSIVPVQGTVSAKPPHLVDVDRLGRDLDPLEAYRRVLQLGPAEPSGRAAPQIQDQSQVGPQGRRFNWQETIVEDVLAMSLESLREEADAELNRRLQKEWEETKDRVLKMFTEERVPTANTLSETDVIQGKRVPGPLDEPRPVSALAGLVSSLDVKSEETPKMSAFYQVVSDSNSSVKSLCNSFRSTSASVGSSLDACEMWSLWSYITDKDALGAIARGLLPKSIYCKRALATRMYLERQYREKVIYSVPSGDIVHEDLFWDLICQKEPSKYGQIFKMCRCGSWEYAAQKCGAFDPNLQTFLKRVVMCQAKRGYTLGFGDGDVYQKTFAGLNSFDFQPEASLVTSVEDFLWFKLVAISCLMQVEGEALEKIIQLQSMVKKEGPAYFNGGASNPFKYARILSICADVESAIDYLARFSPVGSNGPSDNSTVSDPLPDAVHLAIVLNRADGLNLAPPQSGSNSSTSSNLLLVEVGEMKSLRLAKLLELYSTRFADEEKALFYASCLPLPVKDEDMEPAKKILARPHPGGGPLPLIKVLKRNLRDDVTTWKVVSRAAKDARPNDAAQIYYEALTSGMLPSTEKEEMLSESLSLVAAELARVMDMDPKSEERQYWKKEAERFFSLSRSFTDFNAKLPSFITLQRVMDCCSFYDKCAANDVTAPSILDQWLLPPPSSDKQPQLVSFRTRDFPALDRIIIDAFPSLVSKCIECIVKQYQSNRRDEAKQRMESLIAFIAALRESNGYRLRYDVENDLRVANSRIRV